MRFFVSFLCAALACAPTLQALVLENLAASKTLDATLQGKTLGYYIGSFDPLHKGHEDFVTQSLKSGACDYVLITPAWGGDDYKDRTDVKARLEMLFKTYESHPRALVTRLTPGELQDLLTSPIAPVDKKKSAQPHLKGLRIVGMVGSDTALDVSQDPKKAKVFMKGVALAHKYRAHTLGSVMALPADAFVISRRNGQDLQVLDGALSGCPITHVFENAHLALSSTMIRERVAKGAPISDYVNEEVQCIIKEKGLYQKKKQ
ncbi:MAG: hypothetical protein C0514_05910 [Candidatus Puniceispirillum sp.]|nr:hypothetical protein [Candidatus Puniceispirillum sp.]